MTNKQPIIDILAPLTADTHILSLKTQNFHWHVKGPYFKFLHEMFDEQYESLARAVDTLSERIVTLGGQAPATMANILAHKTLDEGDSNLSAAEMVKTLAADHEQMSKALQQGIHQCNNNGDAATADILTERLIEHDKTAWMLFSSQTTEQLVEHDKTPWMLRSG